MAGRSQPAPVDLEPYWQAKNAASSSVPPPLPKSRHPLRISRVNQLDAAFLDSELDNVLLQPFLDTLPARAKEYKSEIATLLRYSLLRLCLSRNAASHGSMLQNLILRDERPFIHANPALDTFVPPQPLQLEAYAFLTVFPSYLFDKLREMMLQQGFADYPQPTSSLSLLLPDALVSTTNSDQAKLRRKRERKRLAWNVLSRAEHIWASLKLANFLVFLLHGTYRSPLERILSLRLIYRQRHLARFVSFEFLNRQLVWEAFTEFMLFLLPLMNLRKLRLRASRLVHRLGQAPQYIQSLLTKASADSKEYNDQAIQSPDQSETKGPLVHLPPEVCAICYSRSAMPTNLGIADAADPTDPTKAVIKQASSLPAGASTSSLTGGEHEVQLPYVTECCLAAYCYYCITAELIQWEESKAGLDGPWSCLRCGRGVTGIKARYS